MKKSFLLCSYLFFLVVYNEQIIVQKKVKLSLSLGHNNCKKRVILNGIITHSRMKNSVQYSTYTSTHCLIARTEGQRDCGTPAYLVRREEGAKKKKKKLTRLENQRSKS